MGMAKSSVENDKKLQKKWGIQLKNLRLMKKYRVLYIVMLFIMAYYVLFHYVPIIMGVLISFKDLQIGGSIFTAKWVGFDNFTYVFKDPIILNVVKNTLEISCLRLVFTFFPPIILTIIVFDMTNPLYKKFSQTIIYIPHFFSWVIIYGIVYAFFSGNGLINNIIIQLGGVRTDFLTSTSMFRPLLIGSQIWKEAGWSTILYFAALTSVSPDLYEAAKIDGAGPIRRTLAITLPAMLPVISFSLIMALGNILNNDFEQILMFYNSAVYEVGDIIDSWVYRVGLGKMQYGIGSAVSLMKATISLFLIVGANAFARKSTGRAMW